MAFTPPPWFDDGYRIHAPTDDTDKRNGRVIAEYKHCPDSEFNDGALLAAAPELYKALLDLACLANQSVELSDWPELSTAIDNAKDVIRKICKI